MLLACYCGSDRRIFGAGVGAYLAMTPGGDGFFCGAIVGAMVVTVGTK